MPVLCPCCKANNLEPNSCRRCKADLSMLWDIETRQNYCRVAAIVNTQPGLAEEAYAVKPNQENLKTIAIASVIAGDFSRAFTAWLSLRKR